MTQEQIKEIDELIKTIRFNKANIDHCISYGTVNGTILADLRELCYKVFQEGTNFALSESQQYSDKWIKLPIELTSELGHKGLLIGEFFEQIEIDNPDYCGCGRCDFCIEIQDEDAQNTVIQKVPVSWSTIKEIYKKIVQFHLPTPPKS